MADKNHDHSREERRALTVRVRKIVGQLNAIEKMIGDDRDCPDILVQLIASRKALKSLTEKLIHQHIHHCVDDAQSSGGKQRLKEFLSVIERYVE